MFEPPAKAVQRELYATAEESADGRARRLALTLDASQTPPKPLWFVLSSGSRGHFRNERDDMFFKISLDGKLIKAVFTRMQVDAAGVMVANSGVTETQPDDVRTKELLRRETEFWLKGAGRKAAKR
jgi:hypothetical protein